MVEKKVICERAETCIQRLVVCPHQKEHAIILFSELFGDCTKNGWCSVSENYCKCVEVI